MRTPIYTFNSASTADPQTSKSFLIVWEKHDGSFTYRLYRSSTREWREAKAAFYNIELLTLMPEYPFASLFLLSDDEYNFLSTRVFEAETIHYNNFPLFTGGVFKVFTPDWMQAIEERFYGDHTHNLGVWEQMCRSWDEDTAAMNENSSVLSSMTSEITDIARRESLQAKLRKQSARFNARDERSRHLHYHCVVGETMKTIMESVPLAVLEEFIVSHGAREARLQGFTSPGEGGFIGDENWESIAKEFANSLFPLQADGSRNLKPCPDLTPGYTASMVHSSQAAPVFDRIRANPEHITLNMTYEDFNTHYVNPPADEPDETPPSGE